MKKLKFLKISSGTSDDRLDFFCGENSRSIDRNCLSGGSRTGPGTYMVQVFPLYLNEKTRGSASPLTNQICSAFGNQHHRNRVGSIVLVIVSITVQLRRLEADMLVISVVCRVPYLG